MHSAGNLTSARRLAAGVLPRGQAPRRIFEMLERKRVLSSIGRGAMMMAVAAMTLTAVEPSLARAGSVPSGNGLSAAAATSGATDFSARRRYYRGGGGAAAAAAFGGLVGTRPS